MKANLCRLSALAIILASASLVPAQVATGTYPYGTFDNKGFDTINIGNLNVHFSIPVLNKAGRGIPFTYNLSFDSSVWYPSVAGGAGTWTPVQNFGWRGVTEVATGYVSYMHLHSTGRVRGDGDLWYTCPQDMYMNFVYHDSFGVAHVFVGLTSDTSQQPPPCNPPDPSPDLTAVASDGSGYTLNVTDFHYSTLTSVSGQNINPPTAPVGSGTATDTNGNVISTDGSGNFTDTLGTAVLTVAGGAPNPQTFTYTDTSGTHRNVQINYSTYTVQTAFGCSGVGEYGPIATSLVSSIVFPDGSTYGFQYESTPNGSGNVTGRLKTVTLPTGGQIQYTYTGSASGESQGIVCQDGSNAGLTRVLTNDSAHSTWTYTRPTVTSATSHTEVVDGLGNHANYDFVLPASGIVGESNWYETSRNIYQQTESGTPTLARQTCYNNASPSCTTTAISVPITQIDTYETLDGQQEHGSTLTYNQYGLKTDQKDYDFGSGARGAVIEEQSWAYPASGIVNLLSWYLKSFNGHIVQNIIYGYDEWPLVPTSGLPQHVAVSGQRGNLTSQRLTTSPTYTTYDDAGQVRTTQDQLTRTTTYSYDSATDAFQTLVSYPTTAAGVTITTGATYDINSGLIRTSIDPNGNITHYNYDTMLRQTGITYPDGGQSTNAYNFTASPATITQGVLQAVGGSTITTTYTLDPYGRVANATLTDSNGNDTAAYTYDGNQNVASVSNPYRSTSDPTYGVTSYSYDSLGRSMAVHKQDSSAVTYSYLANSETMADESGRQRKFIYDGLNRLSQAQEPDSTGAFNYITAYTYQTSTGNYQVVVQQKGGSTNSALWRQRTFTYDGLGRVIQEITPEAGTVSVSYPYPTLVCSSNLFVPCQKTDGRGVVTTYSYDTLNRLTGKSYNTTGTTAAATPSVTYYYDQSSFNGLTIANRIGQQTGMSDGSGQTAWGYDSMGRATNIERTVNGVTKTATYVYKADGTPLSIQDFSGSTVGYGYNNAGLPTSAVDSIHGLNFVTYGGYTAQGLLNTMVQGNASGFAGVTSSNQFNSRLQPSVLSASVPSATVLSLTYGYGTTGQNNGNIQQITNNLNGALTQSFGYDKLNRLTSAQAATTWGDTYTYDPWGNLLQKSQISGTSQGESLSISVNGNNQVSGLAYDAAGNVTTDNLGNAYTYDAENRIRTVAGETYTYDGNGIRVIKSGSSVSRLYWPGTSGQTLDESDLTGGTVVRNIYFNGGLVARVDASGNVHYPVHDHLGSTRVVLSASGQVQDQIDYYPFGTVLSYSSQTSGNQYNYTGYESDTESSSYHAMFRNQSPSLGRFLSSDPYDGSYDFSNPQSMNRYSYALNNPLSFIDPSGLDVHCDEVYDDDTGDSYYYCSDDGGGGGGGGSTDCNSIYTVCVSADPPPSGNCDSDNTVCVTSPSDPVQITIILPGVPTNPTNPGGGGAPNNGNNCSVLDPNCKKPGRVANYLSFLACEYNDTIEQITDEEDGQGTNTPSATPAAKLTTIPLLVYGIVGPTKPWVKVTSTATLSSIMIGTAAHANKACSPSFFGH